MAGMEAADYLALVDVDNIVLAGQSGFSPDLGMRRLCEVSRKIGRAGFSLAVMSPQLARRWGASPWFAFDHWTWREAEVGPDAADHQLIDFGRKVIANHEVGAVRCASGDHIFSALAELGCRLEVVVPRDHHGVAASLRQFVI